MATSDDLSPAVAGQSFPISDDDAAARVANYTADYPETGLIGLRFHDETQFRKALIEAGFDVPNPFPPLIDSSIARTSMGIISRKGIWLRVIIHAYADGQIHVLNAIKENAVPKQASEPPPKQSNWPWPS